MLTNKKKVLLDVLDITNKYGVNSRTFIQKLIFLLKKEYHFDEFIKFYSFFPYNYGPFSNLVYRDINLLKKEDMITDENKLTEKGMRNRAHDPKIDGPIEHLINEFKSLDPLKKYIYAKYPEYTIKSKLIVHNNVKNEPGLFTVGYESKDLDSFLDVLIQNRIDIVIDVRNNPFSMKFDFIKEKLKEHLAKIDIEYQHVPSLGIETELRQNLKTDCDYANLFKVYKKELPAHKVELAMIGELSKTKRVVLLCFEANPNHCHRKIIADYIDTKAANI